jgi:RNA polymerase subunit RPABC4/transcription elongation factor Spt4
MNPCQNCGKLNTPATNFCRFCGTKVLQQAQPIPQANDPYDYSAPRPYAWKTDEFQTQNEARKTDSFNVRRPAANPPPNQQFRPAPLAFQQPQYGAQMQPGGNYAIDPNYHCPKCGSSYLPIIDRRISSAGWITFALLLVFTLIFFWVGLLMKEDVVICPVCRWRLN